MFAVSAWIIDCLLVLIGIVTVWAAARRGFFITVLRLAAWVISIALAGIISAAFAEPIYQAFFAAPVRGLIEQNIGNAVDSSQMLQYAQQMLTELPDAVKQLAAMSGLSSQSLLGNLHENQFTTSNAASLLEQSIAAPACIAAIRIIIALAVFVILLFVLQLVARKLSRIRKIPVFKQTDWILGAVLGVIKALLLIFVLCLLLRAVAAVHIGGESFVAAVENSRIVILTNGLVFQN